MKMCTESKNIPIDVGSPEPSGRRDRKRIATRQAISAAATRLFNERGFDHVTVDEISEAAGVGRMTVFNYFPRKEDMFFDRDEEGRDVLRRAFRERDPTVSPIETLRLLAHRLVAEGVPYLEFSAESQRFIMTIEASETLKARARTIRDELTAIVANEAAESVGRPSGDTDAHLTAALLLATWTAAIIEAHRAYRLSGEVDKARSTLLSLIDRGSSGVKVALAATPYA